MDGTLTETFEKSDQTVECRRQADRKMKAPNGDPVTLKRRTVGLDRTVDHQMTTDSVLQYGEETPEGMLDTIFCSNLRLASFFGTENTNSAAKSVYVVMPKMQGRKGVTFAEDTYSRVEDILHLLQNTVKLRLMDSNAACRLISYNVCASERPLGIHQHWLSRSNR